MSESFYLRLLFFFNIVLVFLSIPISVADIRIKEDTLKAVYSFKFGKFVQWPESKLNNSKKTLGYCILGKNPFTNAAFKSIENALVKGRKLKIQIYSSGLLSDDALQDCHIVYVSQSEKNHQQHILAVLRNRPILTISDIDGFSQKGGMITLININERIHFEINPVAFKRAGLKVSSKLIELARLVTEETSEHKQ
ncbi:MAG: YfiR family protein [Methylococcales bacterium]|nr:YfiR family protein [Methylococcales bacterium]